MVLNLTAERPASRTLTARHTRKDSKNRKLCVVAILSLCAVSVAFFLSQTVQNTKDYHQFLRAVQESEAFVSTSSLWMPSIRDDSKQEANNNNSINDNNPSSSSSSVSSLSKKFQDTTLFWKYDDAAPPIRYAKTHELSSIPFHNRLDLSAFENITRYSLLPQNQYPQKLHLIQTNPSITILPKRYQVAVTKRQTTNDEDENNNNSNNNNNNNSNIPMYLASYRVTHHNNCFSATERVQLYAGGDWDQLYKIPKTDYLGLALISGNGDLTILADVVVSIVGNRLIEHSYHGFSDYRLFTLHDTLYFSTSTRIGRLELNLPWQRDESSMLTKKGLIRLQHYNTQQKRKQQGDNGNRDDDQQPQNEAFQVYLDSTPSCPVVRDNGKNFLYFVDGNNNTVAEYYPRSNPNDVRSVQLDKPCSPAVVTKYDVRKGHHNKEVTPSFQNYHEQRFPKWNDPTNPFLIQDRGSACCVSMEYQNKRYLVGVVHPKTPFPGKRLPPGVNPNIYLSRFFAMEAVPPYTIVARTGAFCFGYPKEKEVANTRLWNSRDVPMEMPGEEDKHNNSTSSASPILSFNCPRIHFIMSMVENVADDRQVVISYGVSDCTSRFITVNKSDIQAMLWPPNVTTSITSTSTTTSTNTTTTR